MCGWKSIFDVGNIALSTVYSTSPPLYDWDTSRVYLGSTFFVVGSIDEY